MSPGANGQSVADSPSLDRDGCAAANGERKDDGGNAEKDAEEVEIGADFTEKGLKAMKDKDYDTAVDCFRGALSMRIDHYGEFAPECITAYCHYVSALLFKDQEDAGRSETTRKQVLCQQNSDMVDTTRKDGNLGQREEDFDFDNFGIKDYLEDGKPEETDKDDINLDLAWKVLNVVRGIVSKQPGGTMDKVETLTRDIIEYESTDSLDKVDILLSLGDAASKRNDFSTSLGDYTKALSILERMAEPDSRRIAEVNFGICLCLEMDSKSEEAIAYCNKAISVCKTRLQLLKDNLKSFSGSSDVLGATDLSSKLYESSGEPSTEFCVSDDELEIVLLTGLTREFETKLQELQQLVSNQTSISPEASNWASAEVKCSKKLASRLGTSNSCGYFNSPTISCTHGNGSVTHLGKVGKGVKRLSTKPESCAIKSPRYT